MSDDSAYLLGTGGLGGPVMLTKGKIYRVRSNRTIGVIYAAGGQISIDPGVMLTVTDVIGSATEVIFIGAGALETKNRTYSVGWFAGNSLNEKWDFCRRSFAADKHYTCLWPKPSKDDPAAVLAQSYEGNKAYMWRVTAPIYFDDPENNGKILTLGKLCVTSACDAALIFSTANKTEEIDFPFGIWVEGRFNCNYGVRINGEARVKFGGAAQFKRVKLDGVYVEPSLPANVSAADSLQFDFLNVTDYGRYGVNIISRPQVAPTGTVLGLRANYLFTNGGAPTSYYAASAPIALLRLAGPVRGAHVGNILENTAYSNGELDNSDALVLIEANDEGAPKNVTLQNIEMRGNLVKALRSYNSGSGSADKPEWRLERLVNQAASGTIVDVQWADGWKVGRINNGAISSCIAVSGNAPNGQIDGNNTESVNGIADRMRINGNYGFYRSLGNNAVFSMAVTGCGLVEISSADNVNAYALFHTRSGVDGSVVAVGSAATFTSGTTPAGTTGAAGKLNCFANGGRLYLENQTGASLAVKLRMMA